MLPPHFFPRLLARLCYSRKHLCCQCRIQRLGRSQQYHRVVSLCSNFQLQPIQSQRVRDWVFVWLLLVHYLSVVDIIFITRLCCIYASSLVCRVFLLQHTNYTLMTPSNQLYYATVPCANNRADADAGTGGGTPTSITLWIRVYKCNLCAISSLRLRRSKHPLESRQFYDWWHWAGTEYFIL